MYVFYRYYDYSKILSMTIPKCYLDTYFKMARLIITQENASPVLLLSMGKYFAGKEKEKKILPKKNTWFLIWNRIKKEAEIWKRLTSLKEKENKSNCECKSS